MTNPNPLYPKGSTYTLEEFIPVVRAAQKMGLTSKSYNHWFKDASEFSWGDSIGVDYEPYTLLQDIQAPYEPQDDKPPVKPLTVEEIITTQRVWFVEHGGVKSSARLQTKGALVALNIPCYATEDDCKRAHRLGVE